MTRSIPRLLAVGMLLGCVVVVVGRGFLPGPRRWLAEARFTQLAFVSDEQVPALIDQLVALDDAGLPGLVAGLDHSRLVVQSASQQGLHRLLDAWQQLPNDESAPKVTRLAQMLAEVGTEADSEAVRRRMSLALRALDWPMENSGRDATALIYACEQVLQIGDVAGVRPASSARIGQARKRTQAGDVNTWGESTKARAENERGMPARSNTATEGSAMDAPLGRRDAIPIQPQLRIIADEPPRPPEQLSERPIVASPAEIRATDDTRSASRQLETQRVFSSEDLVALTELEVIQRLAEEGNRKAAAKELARRGLTARDLQIARALVDRDPQVREQLAQSLPQLPGIDARPWLLLLSRDESPRVRAAAVRWLSTSTDPQIQNQLRAAAETETDESVRQALKSRSPVH